MRDISVVRGAKDKKKKDTRVYTLCQFRGFDVLSWGNILLTGAAARKNESFADDFFGFCVSPKLF